MSFVDNAHTSKEKAIQHFQPNQSIVRILRNIILEPEFILEAKSKYNTGQKIWNNSNQHHTMGGRKRKCNSLDHDILGFVKWLADGVANIF